MADDRLNVLVICGSWRKGSYNAAVARALPELAPAGMSFAAAPPFNTMPHYDEDSQASSGFPEAVVAWGEAIRCADGVTIASPEYNWTIPGALKNAIDWASRLPDQPFKNKPVALQSAAERQMGGSRMQYHMRQCLTSIDALVMGKPEVIVTFAGQKVDETTGELKDEATRAVIRQHLEAFARFIRRVRD
jgi:chromate reductase